MGNDPNHSSWDDLNIKRIMMITWIVMIAAAIPIGVIWFFVQWAINVSNSH